jgi:inosine-uridine nucleoside N-ribohydrolase
VWIDTDVALGARRGDVDDGFALAAILRAPVELLGISTVFGNTRAATSESCARALCEAAGVRAQIIRGAERKGEVTAAAEAIAALPDGTELLALGPLTNVAAALARNPSLRARVRLVGGNLTSWGRWPPLWPFEFNLAKDPEAARALFLSPLPRSVYPLDVCAHLTIGAQTLRALSRGDALARALARDAWRWLARAPLRYGALAFPLWDLVPALHLIGRLPSSTDLRRLRCEGRGRLVDDAWAPEAECLVELDPRAALDAFLQLVQPVR